MLIFWNIDDLLFVFHVWVFRHDSFLVHVIPITLLRMNLYNFQCFSFITITNSYSGALCPWWHNQMETLAVLLTLCEGNPPVTSGFTSQRPVTWSFDVFFDLRLNKRFSKHSRCYLDNKVHVANMGPRWAPCWPHEPCYQGSDMRCHHAHYDVTVISVGFIVIHITKDGSWRLE